MWKKTDGDIMKLKTFKCVCGKKLVGDSEWSSIICKQCMESLDKINDSVRQQTEKLDKPF